MPSNKPKIQNHLMKRQKRSKSRRKINVRAKRKYYLIVCEGGKTEPNYFKSLKKSLPQNVLEVTEFEIKGEGKNTISLVNECIRLRNKYEQEFSPRRIDETWAVFDKDDFPPQNFNNAILKAKGQTPEIECAWTNEAFELWYLLHFNYYNTGMSRKSYQKLIETAFQEAGLKSFKYKKNDEAMYFLLGKYGNQKFAIKNAKKLEKLWTDEKFANHNPCTKVHLLVSELEKLKKR